MENPIMPEISANRKTTSLKEAAIIMMNVFKNTGVFILAGGVAVRTIVSVTGHKLLHSFNDVRYRQNEEKRLEKQTQVDDGYRSALDSAGKTSGAIMKLFTKEPDTNDILNEALETGTSSQLSLIREELTEESQIPTGPSHGQYTK